MMRTKGLTVFGVEEGVLPARAWELGKSPWHHTHLKSSTIEDILSRSYGAAAQE